MARQTKIVNMSLPADLYRLVNKLAKQKKATRSEILRESLAQYVASEQRWKQIRKWGEESAKRLGIRNEEDVDRMIHELRG